MLKAVAAFLMLLGVASCHLPTPPDSRAGHAEALRACPMPPGRPVALAVLTGQINDESTSELISRIVACVEAGAETVVVELNSGGGSVDAGFRIARIFESAPVPIVCVVDNEAASMAYYVLQSCDRRLMTRRAQLMVHNAYLSHEGPLFERDIRNIQAQMRALHESMLFQYSRRTNVALDEFRAKLADDAQWWLTVDEALKLGMVDEASPPASVVAARLRRASKP